MRHDTRLMVLRARQAKRLLAQSILLATVSTVLLGDNSAHAVTLPTTDGFYGIWYNIQPGIGTGLYGPKYGGGLGTYTQQTSPFAYYSEDANRTYFTYGGAESTSSNTLKNYISYYDHDTGLVARPREVRHVGGSDIHKSSGVSIDDDGYIYVFGYSHGGGGTGNLYKSSTPYEITDFDEVALPPDVFGFGDGDNALAYGNPYYVSGEGFFLLYNRYEDGRSVHITTSTDGVNWISPRSGLEESDRLMKISPYSGHYALARPNGSSIGVIANMHPNGLNHRTNLFYMETDDFAETWKTVDGTVINGAITSEVTPALVHDYFAEQKLVYLKDVNYDASGNPILLYLTVSDADNIGHYSGPHPGGRTVHVAHWTGTDWNINDVTTTDHNYDHGEIYVQDDGSWQIIAPFLEGPQQWGTGGAIGVWETEDEGENWALVDQWTPDNSTYNHTYVRRPVNVNDDFYAYWADGDAMQQSQSRLYFANKDGDVFQLPTNFTGDFAAPIAAHLVRSDLDFDDQVTSADWLIYIANELTDVSGLDDEARYALGDINYDGFIDMNDFRIFKADYELANGGPGSFNAMLQSIPEPSTAILALFAISLLGSVRVPTSRRF